MAAAAVFGTGLPASANNYVGATGTTTNCTTGENNRAGLNNTDPNPLTFAYNALEAGTAQAMDFARGVYDATRHDTSLLSGSNQYTDVVAFDQDYSTYCFRTWHPVQDPETGELLIGLAVCTSLASDNSCERHEVRYDLSWMNASGRTQNERNVLACHEVGHSVGLAHRADENGCMLAPFPHSGELTLHDVTHINGGPWRVCCDTYLYAGQTMTSYDGRYYAVMQGDGNFVVYGPYHNPHCTQPTSTPGRYVCWASNTSQYGYGVWAKMQSDGNFVLYVSSSYGNTAICSTGTWGNPGSTMDLQTDGHLVIYAPGRVVKWGSEIGGACR